MDSDVRCAYIMADGRHGWYRVRRSGAPKTIRGWSIAAAHAAPSEARWFALSTQDGVLLGRCRRGTNGLEGTIQGTYPTMEAAVVAAAMLGENG